MVYAASILENDTHNDTLWKFNIQMDLLNLGHKTRPYNNQQKLRTCKIVDFVVLAAHRIKLKENEKDEYLTLAMEREGDNYTNPDWCFWYSHQRIVKGTRGIEVGRTSGDHTNYNIIENGQNTEKCLVS